MNETVLEINNLNVFFQKNQILKNLSFSISKGQTLALLGESGSGKTFTTLSIMRLLPLGSRMDPKSEIILSGTDLVSLSEIEMQAVRGKKIGLIFQEPATALNPVFTVGEQVSECFKDSKRETKDHVLQLLKEVGFPHPEKIYDLYPHQLSGGMRQRVVIAMAVAGNPDLLIADEPTSALDVTTQAQILKLLKKLQQKFNLTILFITHDVNLVKYIADEVAILLAGEIIEETPLMNFFENPQHPYSKKLIASATYAANDSQSGTPQDTILETKNLGIHFPIQKGIFKRTVGWVKAVDDVTLQLQKGKTLALVGESGSGKTTLARGLLHLIKPTTGHIFFEGVDLVELTQREVLPLRKDLQIIFQDPFASLNPRMVVEDILLEGLQNFDRIKKSSKTKLVDNLLKQVGLKVTSKYRYPHEFSGGQRQRIVIARALALNPKVLICDECTSALDVTTQAQIIKLLLDLQQQLKLSYLFITHNIPLAASIADEIAVMYKGKIVEQGTPQQILSSPQHSYTKELLAAVLD